MNGIRPYDQTEIANMSTYVAKLIMDIDTRVWTEMRLSSAPHGELLREYLKRCFLAMWDEVPIDFHGKDDTVDLGIIRQILEDNGYDSCLKAFSVALGENTIDELLALDSL